MIEFLTHADMYLKGFWYIAIPTTLIFVIQAALTIIGVSGTDAEFDGGIDTHDFDSPLDFFTIRNAINFLLAFSWGGIGLYGIIENKFLLIISAAIIGFIFVVLSFYLMQQIVKLEEDNTFTIESILDKEGHVYTPIPSQGQGSGIIQVSVGGAVREIEALSIDQMMPTGTKIKIVDISEEKKAIVKVL